MSLMFRDTRLVGQVTKHVTWIQDWGCETCKRFGGVTFTITGARMDDLTHKPVTKESGEEMLRKIFAAHRGKDAFPACTAPLMKIKLGLAWRYVFEDGVRKQIFLPKKDGWLPKEYQWPPWRLEPK